MRRLGLGNTILLLLQFKWLVIRFDRDISYGSSAQHLLLYRYMKVEKQKGSEPAALKASATL